jgi:uncharacterized protein
MAAATRLNTVFRPFATQTPKLLPELERFNFMFGNPQELRQCRACGAGFNAMRRHEAVGAAQLRKGVDRLGLLQIDSVNILVRAQYVPFFSRLGLYEPALLDALTGAKPKRLFEYRGHEASLLSIDCQPLLRWRMARALRDRGVWRQLEPFAGEKRGEAEALQSEMAFYG